MTESHSTIWVCLCCMYTHANGECCPDDTHGGDSVQPWSTLPDGMHVTMGMLSDEHDTACDSQDDCECAHSTYSTSQCEGCGSYLHGERWAFTLWETR